MIYFRQNDTPSITTIMDVYKTEFMPASAVTVSSASPEYFSIELRYFPDDGIWTASSESIIGLHIEGETLEETQNEAIKWARELLIDNNIVPEGTEVGLIFHRR